MCCLLLLFDVLWWVERKKKTKINFLLLNDYTFYDVFSQATKAETSILCFLLVPFPYAGGIFNVTLRHSPTSTVEEM